MKILVTGSSGFVGKNLVAELKNKGYNEIFEFNKETDKSLLDQYTKDCDFVFHLAGANRPKDEKEFMSDNFEFTSELLNLLKKNNNKSPVLITSSIQAEINNPYGLSKKAAEDLLFDYGNKNKVNVYVYRLPNLFGKWSKANYNTVVATYCYNIARNLDIQISDPLVELKFCYIDDVLDEFLRALNDNPTKELQFCIVPIIYKIKLGDLANRINKFKDSRKDLSIPDMNDELTKKLYSTYLSFLPEDGFSYDLKMNIDDRGSFTEFVKTFGQGQFSVNISKPGITKGNHWHHTKNEKFLVVNGEGIIKFRKINENTVLEYKVSDKKLQVIDIPVGYTHSIVNTGKIDLVTIIWVNESFDIKKPDTFSMEV
ncbi:MAG: NAD-dependent epimerase/dehydratase family protein [Candidatus Shapirobacteria bacterium]|nr:NAD-dependent epimerase/dehydratase family protein [Candidatus Shapirobacteria bacterium]MDD4410508.1 NAD-dependent epimerase/dehydratase family protein [Candidatus Shapirobacteria bacterium]